MVKGNIAAIKGARLERGWSLSELAKQVDVTKETVARIERGLSAYMAAKEITEAEEYKALSELIQRVEDPDQRATLQLRYLDNSEWPDVNFAMFGDLADFNAKERAYQRRVYRIHSRALLILAQIADVEA